MTYSIVFIEITNNEKDRNKGRNEEKDEKKWRAFKFRNNKYYYF